MNIFAYGTLQNSEVIEALLGFKVETKKAKLKNYKVYGLSNRYYPAIVYCRDNEAEGLLLVGLDEKSLKTIKDWEDDEYLPIEVSLGDIKAICFVWNKTRNNFVDGWNNELFRIRDMGVVVSERIPKFLKDKENRD